MGMGESKVLELSRVKSSYTIECIRILLVCFFFWQANSRISVEAQYFCSGSRRRQMYKLKERYFTLRKDRKGQIHAFSIA